MLWNIFYHFFLDGRSPNLLLDQAQKLSDASGNVAIWNQSEYAKFIDIGTTYTLRELHRLWTLYAQTKSFSPTRRADFTAKFTAGFKNTGRDKETTFDPTASRSAGPVAIQALESCREATFRFWESGTTFTSRSAIDAATEVNPTFAYAMGDEGFMPHHGTDPLAAFHLAPIFATASMTNLPPLGQIYRAVQEQFFAWCSAFHECIQSGPAKLRIRVVVADALALCQALQLQAAQSDASVFPRVSAWKALLLSLDGEDYSSRSAPLTFDVIDTSNLCDHVGTVNVLVATSPLLKRSPSAALYTESLLSSGEDPIMSFATSLCSDVTAVSLLFDLTPASCLAGCGTRSGVHELASYYMGKGGRQYHERLTWKRPSQFAARPCRPVAFDPADVASLLFRVYLRMFAHEAVPDTRSHTAATSQVRALSRVHYTRRSFANTIATDWSAVCDQLAQHLHLAGVWSTDSLVPGNQHLYVNKVSGPFREWKSVPPVVCVAFVVPCAKLSPLDDPDAPPNPVLAVELLCGGDRGSNYFASIDAAFGALCVTGTGECKRAIIEEDSRGKAGGADVVISVCVTSAILAVDPSALQVRLSVAHSPSAVLVEKLGPRMLVHYVPLSDGEQVHVLRERPTVAEGVSAAIPQLPQVVPPPTPAPVSLSVDGAKVGKMTRRLDAVEVLTKAVLASRDTAVTTKQAGPSEIEVSIGSAHKETFAFPYPVDATKARLRVARKSAWIEIVAEPCLLGHPDTPVEARFPITMDHQTPIPWAIHRLNLERLPVLSTSGIPKERLGWLNTHVSLALSDREQRAREAKTMDTLAHVKDSLHSIVVHASGFQGPKPVSVVGLNLAARGGVDTLLFIPELRVDVAAHTIVADAYVLPVHISVLPELMQPISAITPEILQVMVTDDECMAWKHLLPNLVEHCRTWVHTPQCAYRAPGARIPLVAEYAEIPICACGQGKVGGAFRAHDEWAPFAPYVTRVALSPLFAVSFLESVAGKLKGLKDDLNSRLADTSSSSGTDGVEADLSRRCKKVAYCGDDCQRKDWKSHKRFCTA
ncbi:zinc finger MYND domain-containing protein [Phanerochaete sordida]|uniref:Zinc finger MYND domain-containing protein n=1 Tax=Phanerochaete sordida TaxID=48140 RepID=A0A9P3FZM5_9APHY|nr:zinc finger MYND domain-containing protein [Phanerochaete sordida]